MNRDSTILFQESQRFRKPWLLMLLLFGMLIPIGLLVYMFTIDEANFMELVLSLIAVVAIEIPIFVLIHYSRLELKVIPEGFGYRWWPLQKKFRMILPEDTAEMQIRESPVATYGMHWRFRYGWVNTAGAKKGVQFKLKSGKRIFVGSEHIDELRTALEKVFNKAIGEKRNEF